MPSPTGSTAWKYSNPTLNEQVNSLGYGIQWSKVEISYSFVNENSYFLSNYPENNGYIASLSESDQGYVRKAFEAYSNVSQLSFSESSDNRITVGDLRLGYSWTSQNNDALAWTYLPGSNAKSGDIWFNTFGSAASKVWVLGSYQYMSLIHELGHALGLKHPFSTSTYNTQVLDPSFDSRSYTIMSYSALDGDQSTYFSFEPTSLMILDVAAIQALYGSNTHHQNTDTRYVYQSNRTYHETIWDTGGNDTIVYESSQGGSINLTSGLNGGSQLGQTIYINDKDGQQLQVLDKNIWIANDVTIENAIGGTGDDQITGNTAANRLEGGDGDDIIDGGSGNDVMIGGAGNDYYYIDNPNDQVIENTNEGDDTLAVICNYSISQLPHLEHMLVLGNLGLTLIGNQTDNHLTGGAGVDKLDGGAGNDQLDGGLGADKLIGGTGDDTYVIDNAKDSINDSAGSDLIQTNLSTFSLLKLTSIESLRYTGLENSQLIGNKLANQLWGNSGDDRIDGGLGNDTLSGGGGSDHFVFTTALKNNTDTITDFVSGTDHLDLSLKIFTKLKNDTDLSDNFCVNNAQDNNDYFIYNNTDQILYYDADGIGSKATPIAIVGCAELSVTDILLF